MVNIEYFIQLHMLYCVLLSNLYNIPNIS